LIGLLGVRGEFGFQIYNALIRAAAAGINRLLKQTLLLGKKIRNRNRYAKQQKSVQISGALMVLAILISLYAATCVGGSTTRSGE